MIENMQIIYSLAVAMGLLIDRYTFSRYEENAGEETNYSM